MLRSYFVNDPFMPNPRREHILDLRIPPLALVMIVALFMWLGATHTPGLGFRVPFQSMIALSLLSLGVLVCVVGVLQFKKAKTTVNPTKPQASSSLVTTGIYRRSRNPMYLGFLLILAAWAAFTACTISLLGLPAFVAYMNQFQIKPEERALTALFDKDFRDYCSNVRRWI